jgi:hypothetical protein
LEFSGKFLGIFVDVSQSFHFSQKRENHASTNSALQIYHSLILKLKMFIDPFFILTENYKRPLSKGETVLKPKKHVKFSKTIRVILIPHRQEYLDLGLELDLWYDKRAMKGFLSDARKEGKAELLRKQIQFLTLLPNDEEIDDAVEEELLAYSKVYSSQSTHLLLNTLIV